MKNEKTENADERKVTNTKKGLNLYSTLSHEVGPLAGDLFLLALEVP